MFDYEKINIERVKENLSECMVLLKKDGKFPLDRPCRIACFGNGVRKTLKGGTGSGEVNSHFFKNIEETLADYGFTVTTKYFLDEYDLVYKKARKEFIKGIKKEAKKVKESSVWVGMGAVMLEPDYEIMLDYNAEACIYVLSRICGEGNDRLNEKGDFKLTDTEIRDINKLNSKYEKFMLVLNVGGPVDLTYVLDVKNILILSQLGVETSSALCDVILGKTNPSGKLTTTWASFEEYNKDIDFGDYAETNYFEGIYVGYRYFDSANVKPLYPFGYGLSYSEFSYEFIDYKINDSIITINVKVKNIGSFKGKEVIQTYLSSPSKKLDKAYQELCGFKKTRLLEVDEEETLSIEFDLLDYASFDTDNSYYILEEGKYNIYMGNSSRNTINILTINLVKDLIVSKVKNITTKPQFTDKVYNNYERTYSKNIIDLDLSNIKTKEFNYEYNTDINEKANMLSNEELVLLSMGKFDEKGLISVIGNAGRTVAGSAGETRGLDGILPITMADGPAGLRLARRFYKDKKGTHPVGENGMPESFMELLSGPARLFFKIFVHNKKKTPKKYTEEYQYATAIPIGVAIAQSFNLEYANTLGDVVGDEMERFGVNLWLAPALNIHRSILCGRNFEYYSEDPLISGKFAGAITKGVESHKNCGVTIKHYCCNNQEYFRLFNNSNVSERALREIYLKGFNICIKENNPKALMTSYNLVNGIHSSESYDLVTNYLKVELNYKGLIMSDWASHHYNKDRVKYAPQNPVGFIKAGGNVFMPGSSIDYNDVLNSLNSGKIELELLKKNASIVINKSNDFHK
ncbi:MAG: glycoside hydrolase family 3 C-terminal domain-containing protein [Acholeplasmatales bacterium]|nr:glycoside hydrolase family 3 C-terminal domain-containing protein [Acholeplasmatales bacterium]